MNSHQAWNFRTAVRLFLGKRPLDCECGYCDPDSTFICPECLKYRAYCQGQDDDHYELCTECWFTLYGDGKMDNLRVESCVEDGRPVVQWRFKGSVGYYSPNQARERAIALIEAAMVAKTEARVIKQMVFMQKGFSPDKLTAILAIVRRGREAIPFGLTPIFGHHTKLPLVDCDWYGEKLTFTVAEAMSHAQALLQIAEGAETDAFLSSEFEAANLSPLTRVAIYDAFKNYRADHEKK